MPEFAEVFALYYALDKLDIKTITHGKHLFLSEDGLDFTFGLNGTVSIDPQTLELTHKQTYGICGTVNQYINVEEMVSKNRLGIDLTYSSIDAIEKKIMEWSKRNKTLGSLILDQGEIAGIGVAWGSEILYSAGLTPGTKACSMNELDIQRLRVHMLGIRNIAINIYMDYIEELYRKGGRHAIVEFINSWFKNLYEIRKMDIYKQPGAIKEKVAGRDFYVKKP
jgi:formamidopyrimidine-DNA glycosylase